MTDNAPSSDFKTRAMLLVRYALAGGLTSLVYMIVYVGLVEVTGLVRFLASNLGYGCALLVQYTAHSRFTFGHRAPRVGKLWRYLFAVGFGFVMAALVSQAHTKLFTLTDITILRTFPLTAEIQVSAIVMVLVAISNFFFFNFWVYAHHAKPISKADDFD